MRTPKSFRPSRVAMAASLAILAALPQLAMAGVGWADSTGAAANPATLKARTYYASSPFGTVPVGSCFDNQGNPYTSTLGVADCDAGGYIDSITGASMGLRKFVDTLPGLTAAGANTFASGGPGQYIPVAVADQATYPGSDYYEIAVVEYQQKMHSDLANPSTLRGYVQIDPLATDTAGVSKSAGSLGVALTNPNGTPVMIARPDGNGGFVEKQAYGFDTAHYLGPVIVANQFTPTRMKFYNALPVGRVDAQGKRVGDLFLPVDETLPGAGYGPDGLFKYTQNRAEIHLHGGDNPWISDGTPQQWITPAGEADLTQPGVAKEVFDLNNRISGGNTGAGPVDATNYLRGVSAYNVPDMPEPGPGAVTYYFPNGGTARLMFYHDHAFGLTRLNVYAGEAAGYVLRDAAEAALTSGTGALAGVPEIPLVIQEKTFVPKNISMQDAKWDIANWGREGDLWFPHVYEINQDPTSQDATNPGGRWDWGPWFWPVFPSTYDMPSGDHGVMAGARDTFAWTSLIAPAGLMGPSDLGLSEVTTTPEAFGDTPIVNGVAYPELTVEPKAYRFRVLNATNDRALNLNFFVAVTADSVNPNDVPSHTDPSGAINPDTGYPVVLTPVVCDGTQDPAANCSEVDMVRFVSPNAILSTVYACPASGFTEATQAFPVSFPCAGGLLGTGWGAADNRAGGVPNPANMGPDIHQIGTEAGFFGRDVIIPPTVNNFEYNKRSVTVLNVQEHGMFLGAAERADIVVDFSAYAGKTLILYNDAPAPAPAGDPRIDYYTGAGDQTAAGGAINTLPGYGPNTRTVMRVKVAGTPAPAFDFDKLNTDLRTAYVASQAKPIVPQLVYNAIFPGIAAKDTYANIFTGAIYLGNYKPLTFTTTTAIDYTPAPGTNYARTVGNVTTTVTQGRCTTAAICQAQTDAIKAAGLVHVPAGTAVNAYVENKTIQELFDPNWGRMNATLGIEQPFVSALVQTTIPLGYVDPATEFLKDGETQIWKITHNGVDSHPVHFHLVNLQIVNRVGWDGTVKPPYPEDIGWKETIKMSPLEDIIVAATSKKPVMPFGLPHSYRAMDTSQPLVDAQGNPVTAGFTQINAITGNPALVANAMVDYKNEYVWHCHILGHEENDFMRAVVFDPLDQVPDAPTVTAVNAVSGNVLVSWTDPTPAAAPTTPSNPKNEIGFRVERARVTNGVTGTFTALAKVTTYPQGGVHQPRVNTLANATSFQEAAPPVGDYEYKVIAVNAAGETASAGVRLVAVPAAPTNLRVTADTASSVSLAWTDNATNETSYLLSWTSGTAASGSQSLAANTTSANATGLAANTAYSFTLAAVNSKGSSTSATAPGTTAPAAVTGLAGGSVLAGANATLNLSWTNGNPNLGTLTSVVITGTVGGTAITPISLTGAGIVANGTRALTGLAQGQAYALTVTVNGVGGSATAPVSGYTAGGALVQAGGLSAQIVSQTLTAAKLTGATFALNWTDNSTNETGYQVEICHGTSSNCTAASSSAATLTTANTWYTVPSNLLSITAPAGTGSATATVSGIGATPATDYYFRVSPINGATVGTASAPSAMINLTSAPAVPTSVTAVSSATGSLTISWIDAANSNVAYSVQYAQARALSSLTISNAGRGYTSAPTVTIVPNAADAGKIAATATATATIATTGANAGRVTGLTITNPGSGYTVAPTVTFTSGGFTTSASATAAITAAQNYTTAPASTNGLSTSQTITGLASGKGYIYRVSATGAAGSAGSSAAVPATAPVPVVIK